MIDDAEIDAAINAFDAASLGAGDWDSAVSKLAAAAGSMTGELIGIGCDAVVPFNIMTGVAPGAAAEFVQVGGADPAVNSRVRIGSRPKELEVLDEHAFTTEADMRRHPAYGDWIRKHDLRHICLTPLLKNAEMLVGLAVVRSGRQGDIDREQKRAFAALASEARTAVRVQMALQHQGLAMMTGILDSIDATVFLCDQFGRVKAMTQAAEALAEAGDILRLSSGCLFPAREGDRSAYEAALGRALRAEPGRSEPVAFRRSDESDGLLVDVVRVPQTHPLRFGVSALVVVHRPAADDQRIAAAARSLFGFSDTESYVAAQLAKGRPASAIAADRGIAIGTVRTHIRRIFDKTGVSSQLGVAALLARFG